MKYLTLIAKRPVIIILLFSSFYFQCNTGGRPQEDYGTGLIYAKPEDLRGIADAELPHGFAEPPRAVDMSSDMPPVGNQGKQNSCVGWATAYALKYYQEKKDIKQDILFSPAYIYNQINFGNDGGSRYTDALNILSQQGAGLWNDMPYTETDYRTQPTNEAKQKAKPYNIIAWQKVTVKDHMQVKRQVGAGNPVMIAVETDEGFKKADRNGQPEYTWKQNIGRNIGGHAMVVVGYDDARNAFKVLNSWGTNWGNNGYCWIDYQFFEKITSEGYIAKDNKTQVIVDNTTNTTTTTTTTPTVIKPDYDPTQYQKADFYDIQVTHNRQDPEGIEGNGMLITGVANIPRGLGRTFQISTHFYYSNSVTQVGSLKSPRYADVNGYAAAGTILYSIPDEGLNHWRFEIFMPYSAFNVQTGYYDASNRYQYKRTYMYAVPTLFIDNFGYAKGSNIDFYVDK